MKRLLIANRGEIACRIIATAKRLGLETIAIYSEADAQAKHVRMADQAVLVGPAPSSHSYRNQQAILKAAQLANADAIHPGYGFLSENASFAQAVLDAGFIWVGPPPAAIGLMGDKIEAKKWAQQAGVSTLPGSEEALASFDALKACVQRLGYPVILKAAAGGGGKGMRVVNKEEDLKDAYERAISEAQQRFGDERLLVERYIYQPRHIEIQILADTYGHQVHLGERECSIQRRHQKIIEESPSPLVDAAMRKAMGDQALLLTKAVGYVSAGTVEFIVDRDKNFYFLEMNTRLQVEHPVTELVYGLDLVEWMLRIAKGERLTLQQETIKPQGHAIEARICAEDPFLDFLPSSGTLKHYHEPVGDIRVDSGIEDGDMISIFYDSMVSKVIAWGEHRDNAIQHLSQALDQYVIEGISHNIPLVQAILAHPAFNQGLMTTHFIADHYPHGLESVPFDSEKQSMLAAVAAKLYHDQTSASWQDEAALPSLVPSLSGHYTVQTETHLYRVHIHEDSITIDDQPILLHLMQEGTQRLIYSQGEGRPYIMQGHVTALGHAVLLYRQHRLEGRVLPAHIERVMHKLPVRQAKYNSQSVKAPMPGLVMDIMVKAGQEVKPGDALVVLEAMKMENILRADRHGKVIDIFVLKGETVQGQQNLLQVLAA